MCKKCNEGCNSCTCTCNTYNTCEDPCAEQDCGCDFLVPTDCVVTEEDYNCIGTVVGEKLKKVLSKIDEKLCDVTTPADGVDGDSAYNIWINLGNTGTEQEFLDSLVAACDCESNEVLIKEEATIPNTLTGSWGEVPTVITPVGFEYTVPVGEVGLYNIDYQCTVTDTVSINRVKAEIFVDGAPVSMGMTAASLSKDNGYQNIYLLCYNVYVLAGQTISLKLSSLETSGAFIQNKFRIIKK